jgi:Ca2+-binding EF-hand superfamily protein
MNCAPDVPVQWTDVCELVNEPACTEVDQYSVQLAVETKIRTCASSHIDTLEQVMLEKMVNTRDDAKQEQVTLQLQTALSKLNRKTDQLIADVNAAINDFVKNHDKNENKKISQEEFLEAMSKLKDEKMRYCDNAGCCTSDPSGYVCKKKEAAATACDPIDQPCEGSQGPPSVGEDPGAFCDFLDSSNNGILTLREVKAKNPPPTVLEMFKVIDHDRNNMITVKDCKKFARMAHNEVTGKKHPADPTAAASGASGASGGAAASGASGATGASATASGASGPASSNGNNIDVDSTPSCEDIFIHIDKNGDDKISRDEARPFFGSDPKFDEHFDMADKDGDKGISRDECEVVVAGAQKEERDEEMVPDEDRAPKAAKADTSFLELVSKSRSKTQAKAKEGIHACAAPSWNDLCGDGDRCSKNGLKKQETVISATSFIMKKAQDKYDNQIKTITADNKLQSETKTQIIAQVLDNQKNTICLQPTKLAAAIGDIFDMFDENKDSFVDEAEFSAGMAAFSSAMAMKSDAEGEESFKTCADLHDASPSDPDSREKCTRNKNSGGDSCCYDAETDHCYSCSAENPRESEEGAPTGMTGVTGGSGSTASTGGEERSGSEDEEFDCDRMISSLDTNGDKEISFKEAQKVYGLEENFETVFRTLDVDGSGRINLEECQEIQAAMAQAEQADEAASGVSGGAASGSSGASGGAASGSSGASGGAGSDSDNRPTCKEIFQHVDANQDGSISKEEARPFFGEDPKFNEHFDQADQDGNGSIDMKECKNIK